MPKPKFPLDEKLSLRNSYSLTLSPRSKISSAFGPLTVQWTAIFSLRRMPKERTVYLALEKTGVWPVNDSNTFAALVSLSPVFSKAKYTVRSFGIRRNEKIAVHCTVRGPKAEE